MENKTLYGVGRFRSEEFLSLFSSEVRRTSCLSIFLSLLLSLVLLAFSMGVVSFERVGRYWEKAEVLRRVLVEQGEQRLSVAMDNDLWGSRMVEAVSEGKALVLREKFDVMNESYGVVGFCLTRDGHEVFRIGNQKLPGGDMIGQIFPQGGLQMGKTFVLIDDEGQPHPDLCASVWLDLSGDLVQMESFSQDRYALSPIPVAGAIPVIPGVWLIRPSLRQILTSLGKDRGLLLVFLGQTLCVFLLAYVVLAVFSQREGRSQRVISLAGILEEKDPYTMGHSDRVAHMAEKIGRKMGVRWGALKKLGLAARVHDLGKIFVPADILGKRGSLTHREWLHIWRHSVDSERIFLKLFPNRKVARIVRSHHERWDGKGYPDGLVREEISLESRIIAVADSFDTMTTKRPYRDAMAVEKALQIIEQNAGSQFDPSVVRKAVGVLREMFVERIAEETWSTELGGKLAGQDTLLTESLEMVPAWGVASVELKDKVSCNGILSAEPMLKEDLLSVESEELPAGELVGKDSGGNGSLDKPVTKGMEEEGTSGLILGERECQRVLA